MTKVLSTGATLKSARGRIGFFWGFPGWGVFFRSMAFASVCLVATVEAVFAGPSIIPLPAQLQTKPGIFTLCPSQIVPGATAPALIKILVDGGSYDNGQFLALMLYRSTGFRFVVATNTSAGPVRNSIL